MRFKQIGIPAKKDCNNEMEVVEQKEQDEISIAFDVEKRVIKIEGVIGQEDGMIFEDVVEVIKEYIPVDEEGNPLADKPEPLTKLEIHINSDGGSVDAALNIVSQIGELIRNGVEVEAFVKEKACSMAFIIAIVCSHRKMRKYAKLMAHPSYYAVDGQIALTVDALNDFIKTSKDTWKVFEEIMIEHTKMNKKLIDKIYKDCQDFYMNSKDALSYGCIDEIV